MKLLKLTKVQQRKISKINKLTEILYKEESPYLANPKQVLDLDYASVDYKVEWLCINCGTPFKSTAYSTIYSTRSSLDENCFSTGSSYFSSLKVCSICPIKEDIIDIRNDRQTYLVNIENREKILLNKYKIKLQKQIKIANNYVKQFNKRTKEKNSKGTKKTNSKT